MQAKLIAASTHVQTFAPQAASYGINQVTNEGAVFRAAASLEDPNQDPVAVWRDGRKLGIDEQNQTQELTTGTTAQEIYVVAYPAPRRKPGSTIEAGAYIAKPNNAKATLLTADFTVPAIGTEVTIAVLSSAGFSGTYDSTGQDKTLGVFIDGLGFCDFVEAPDAKHLKITPAGDSEGIWPGTPVTIWGK